MKDITCLTRRVTQITDSEKGKILVRCRDCKMISEEELIMQRISELYNSNAGKCNMPVPASAYICKYINV